MVRAWTMRKLETAHFSRADEVQVDISGSNRGNLAVDAWKEQRDKLGRERIKSGMRGEQDQRMFLLEELDGGDTLDGAAQSEPQLAGEGVGERRGGAADVLVKRMLRGRGCCGEERGHCEQKARECMTRRTEAKPRRAVRATQAVKREGWAREAAGRALVQG